MNVGNVKNHEKIKGLDPYRTNAAPKVQQDPSAGKISETTSAHTEEERSPFSFTKKKTLAEIRAERDERFEKMYEKMKEEQANRAKTGTKSKPEPYVEPTPEQLEDWKKFARIITSL